ncbi:MAG: N-acetyltransferase [Planctomycetes bacterium]|nr:N-acetyltransferase [Planctomycetota bacterium]
MSCYAHPTALVESEAVGSGTRVWAYAHVLKNAQVGENCNIGDHAFVESGAVVGNNVTLKNHVCVWEGVTLEDDVFVGPQVAFTNDRYPRSPRMAEVRGRYADKNLWLVKTVVEQGCSIGANATIICGVRLGRYCVIAAGAIVTKDVEPFALMMGSPARRVGTVCVCGEPLAAGGESKSCSNCQAKAAENGHFQSHGSAR